MPFNQMIHFLQQELFLQPVQQELFLQPDASFLQPEDLSTLKLLPRLTQKCGELTQKYGELIRVPQEGGRVWGVLGVGIPLFENKKLFV